MKTVEVGGGDMLEALGQAARAIGKPFGWVVASDDLKPCPVPQIRTDASDPSAALDWITAQCPEYTWRQDQFGIVVQPVTQMRSILDLPIRDFSLTNVKVFEAQSAVERLPEVRDWLQANAVRRLALEDPSTWRGIKTTFSIDLHSVSLRQILDEIALKSGRMTWRIVWFDHDRYLEFLL